MNLQTKFDQHIQHLDTAKYDFLLEDSLDDGNACDIFISEHGDNGFCEFTGIRVTPKTMSKYIDIAIKYLETDTQPENPSARLQQFLSRLSAKQKIPF